MLSHSETIPSAPPRRMDRRAGTELCKRLWVAGVGTPWGWFRCQLFFKARATERGERVPGYTAVNSDRPLGGPAKAEGLTIVPEYLCTDSPKGPFYYMKHQEADCFKCLYYKGFIQLILKIQNFKTSIFYTNFDAIRVYDTVRNFFRLRDCSKTNGV